MGLQIKISLPRDFLLMLCLATTNFWTVAENSLKVGVATIQHERERLPAVNVQSSPKIVVTKWYNFSVTNMYIETTSAWKTYSFLSSINPYDYDVLAVEWTRHTSTTLTTYVTGIDPLSDQMDTHRYTNTCESPCQLVCLEDRNHEGTSLLYNLTFRHNLQFPYKRAQVFPHDYDLVTNILGVLKLAGWKDLVLIYDGHYKNTAEVLIKRLDHSMGLEVFKINETGDLEGHSGKTSKKFPTIDETRAGVIHSDVVDNLLKELYFNLPRRHDLQTLLLCSLDNVKTVLTQANNFDSNFNKTSAMYMRSQWVVVAVGLSTYEKACDFLQLLEQLDNVALFETASERQSYIAQVSASKRMQEIIDRAIWTADRQNKSMKSDELKAFFAQGFLSGCPTKSAWVYTLYYGKHHKRYFKPVAMVTNGEPDKRINRNLIFPNRKYGFNNRTLRLAVFQWPTFYYKNSSTTYNGVIIDLFERLQSTLNFTVQYISPAGLMTVDKIVEQFDKEDADLVLPVFPRYIKGSEHLFDITLGFHKEEGSVVFRKPHKDDDKWLTLIKPFRYQVHMMLFVTIAVYGVLTAVMERVNPYYLSKGTSLHSIIESIQYMFGALLNQGGSCLPSSVTGRVLVSFWWLFSIIIASTYGGNLIAFLTVSKESLPFEDIHGLIKQSKYKWGFINGTIPDDLVKSSKVWNKVYSKAMGWKQNFPGVLSSDIKTHWEQVKTHDYAFIGPSSLVKAWVQSDCNLASFPISVEGLSNTAAIGLVKGSPYTDLFTRILSLTLEAGLIDHWLSHSLVMTAAFCEGSLIAEAQAISLLDVQSAFYACVIGIVLSALILGGEYAVQHISIWWQAQSVDIQTHSATNVSSTLKTTTMSSSTTIWQCLRSMFNPFRRRLQHARPKQSAILTTRPPSWPKADTRSVWDFNTSFRRPSVDPIYYTVQGGKVVSKECRDNNYRRRESVKHSVSVISYSRPSLRPSTMQRRRSFTDLRYLQRFRSEPKGRYSTRGSHPTSEVNRVVLDGWFNPCFCDSDSSIDEIEERQSDDGAGSCDSGLDRSSVTSTRFGDLDSELW